MTSDANSCATGFTWVGVVEEYGLGTTIDGIIGLQSGADGVTENYFVPFAYDQGILSEPTFSVYMALGEEQTDTSGNSYIDFGAPVLGG